MSTNQEKNITKRLTKLEKELEEKNRELEIEAALEGVRAKTMGMHSSSELSVVIKEVTDQMQLLGFDFDTSNIGSQYDKKGFYIWNSVPGEDVLAGVYVPKAKVKLIDWFYAGMKSVNKVRSIVLNKKDTNAFFKYYLALESTKQIPADRKKFLYSTSSISLLTEFRKDFTLSILNYRGVKYSEEESKILSRFANAFEQAYTRFLDLQKAEAQTKEAQIEAGLERVRSRAMAMQSSEELGSLIGTMFTELTKLDLVLTRCVIWIIDHKTNDAVWWMANSEDASHPMNYDIPYHEQTPWLAFMNEWKKRTLKWVYDLKGQTKKEWDDHLFSKTGLAKMPKFISDSMRAPDRVLLSASFNNFGGINVASLQPLSDEHFEILLRFAKVFDLTYTRFNDLKQAEAQAREAEIELALERVRARAMAMQKPSEFVEVVNVIGEQFLHLGFDIEWANFGANGLDIAEGIDTWNFAVIPGGEPVSSRLFIPRFDHPVFTDAVKQLNKYRRNGDDLFIMSYGKKIKDRWLDHLFSKTIFKDVPGEYRTIQYAKPGYTTSNLALKDTFLSIGKFDSRSFNDEQHSILRRIGKAFGQAYTRFQDLQKAEAQAREAQIEAALERVRARTMAMHKSSDMLEVVKIVGEQFELLGFKFNSVNFNTDTHEKDWNLWLYNVGSAMYPGKIHVPYIDHPCFNRPMEAFKKGGDLHSFIFTKEEKDSFFDHIYTNTVAKYGSDERKKFTYAAPGFAMSTAVTKNTRITITNFNGEPFSEDENAILRRFANVFEQSYTRFLDLQKAEAQAREAQIEAALERVRSKTMGMHHSNELHDVIETVTNQLLGLGLKFDSASFCTVNDDGSWELWISTPEQAYPSLIHVPYLDHKIFNQISEQTVKGAKFFTDIYDKKQTRKFYKHFFEKTIARNAAEERKRYVLSRKGFARSVFLIKDIWFSISVYEPIPFSDEDNFIINRFAKVFEQSYTRFLDLQKAEAQAREAQIEAALEKVRARTMGMQHSDELPQAANLLFQQVQSLGMPAWSAGYCIWNDDEKKSLTAWMSSEGVLQPPFKAPTTEDELFIQMRKGSEQGKSLHVVEMGGEKLVKHYQYMRTLPVVSDMLDSIIEAGFPLPAFQIMHHAYFSKGFLLFITYEPVLEAHDIFKRFAKVFEQTYTRFLDLQKAEAQSRESQIQLVLERVRARTMAMQKSDELKSAATLLFQQVKALGVPAYSCGYNIWEKNEKVFTSWMSTQDGTDINAVYNIPLTEDANFIRFADSRQKNEQFFVLELRDERMQEHYEYLKAIPAFKAYFDYAVSVGYDLPKTQIHHIANFSHGNLLFITLEPCPEFHDVFKRFAEVFDQTYTRFLDLQKAEAQARESQIQLALERVRARTMAMQRSDELPETSHILYEQMKELGEPVEQLTIGVVQEENKVIEISATLHGDILKKIYRHSIDEPFMMSKIYHAWKTHQKTLIVELKGDELNAYNKYRNELTRSEMFPTDLGDEHRRIVYAAFYSKGMLALGANEPRPPESLQLLERFAGVFDQAYIRFIDLKKAEAQTRESQIQLALERVRARTMAMQKSNELQEVVNSVYEHLNELEVRMDGAAICTFIEGTKDYNVWIGDYQEPLRIKFNEFTRVQRDYNDAIEKREELFTNTYSGEIKEEYIQFLLEQTVLGINIPEEQKQLLLTSAFFTTSLACTKNTVFQLYRYTEKSFSKEENDILKRFANVFEQSYTRFLDLQKAEAQAREAQIETALERVRSRTMAMQKSDELQSAALLLFQQTQALGARYFACGFNIWDEDRKAATAWMAREDKLLPPFKTLSSEDVFLKILEAAKRGESLFVKEQEGEELETHYRYMASIPIFKDILEEMKQAGLSVPTFQIIHCAFFAQGYLMFISFEPVPEAYDIFKRFAKAFEQTYTRFLDLQKAEAQAKESQIQLALERVRARTMAMQKSDELQETAYILFQQFKELGEDPVQITIGIFNEEERKIEFSITGLDDSGSKIDQSYKMDIDEPILMSGIYKAWKEQKTSTVFELSGKELSDWITYRNKLGGLPQSATPINYEEHRSVCAGFFSKGFISFSKSGSIPNETIVILERFAGVFDLTYTRFLDLKQAEAQAQEAQVQLALERVRARTMAMQKSDELPETSLLLFQQMKEFGETVVQNSIGIIKEEEGFVELSTTVHGHHEPKTLHVPINDPHVMAKAVAAWKAKLKSLTLEFKGQELKDYNELRNSFLETKVNFPEDNWVVNLVFFSKGWLSFSSNHEISKGSFQLLERFAGVFDLTYTRFLDLKQAEGQAREAKIEAALERVRSRTMAMHQTSELQEVIHVVHKELLNLDLSINGGSFVVINKDIGPGLRCWGSGGTADTSEEVQVPDFNMAFCTNLIKGIQKGSGFFTEEFSQEEKKEYFTKLFEQKPWSDLSDEQKNETLSSPAGYTRSVAVSKYTSIFIINHHGRKFTEEENDILRRFAKVFEQTYTRFLDLQRAEAQARESQIETALERIRAVAMAMRKPEELMQISKVIYDQLQHLGFENLRNVQIAIDDDEKKTYNGVEYSEYYQNRFKKVPYDSSPLFSEIAKEIKRSHTAFYQKEISGQEFEDWRNWRTNIQDREDSNIHPGLAAATSMCFYLHSVGTGMLGISTFKPTTNEQLDILKRFKNVFELSYRRYIDIEKAELQAREAQIELALERVRARTMAMHRSEELAETAQVLFHQLNELNVVPDRIAIGIVDEINNVVNFWSTDQAGSHIKNSFRGRLDERTVMSKGYTAWKDHQRSLVIDLHGDDLKEWIQFAREEMKIPVDEKFIKDRRVHSFAFFSHGWILVTTHEPQSSEAIQILERFASVFNLTYRRFLDLEKAEAQVREAQIEAALERVRAKAMAMHKTEDLNPAVAVVFEELEKLNIGVLRCGISILNKEKRTGDIWVTSTNDKGSVVQVSGDEAFDIHPLLQGAFEAWLKQEDFSYMLEGEDLSNYYNAVKQANFLLPESQRGTSKTSFNRQYCYTAVYQAGGLFAFRNEEFSDEGKKVMRRFANVFDLTYKRFLDLQKAEANAREAQIEAGLERVRSRTMAMYKSDELAETAVVLFKQMIGLGIATNRLYIAIINDDSGDLDFWITDEDGEKVSSRYVVNIQKNISIKKMYEGWMSKKKTISIDMQGKELEAWLTYWKEEFHVPFKPGVTLNRRVQNIAYFSKGFIAITSPDEQPVSTINLLERFAAVFNLTYTRFSDLQQAEAQAREAQIEAGLERVRARTMAMHSSDDVSIATATMFTELEKLGIQNLRGGITIVRQDQTQEVWSVTNLQDGRVIRAIGVFDMRLHPLWRALYEGKQRKDDYQYYWMAGKDKEDYINILNATPNYLAHPIKDFPDIHVQSYFFGEGAVWTNSLQPHSEEDKQIMKRFAGVFGQTYRRYLDLQKAEAQAKEAQVEAALEKVRASTMAMQKSEDLSEAAFVLFKQFKELGELPERIFIATFDNTEETVVDLWGTNQGGNQLNKLFRVSADEPTVIKRIVDAWKEKKSSVVIDLTGDELQNYLKFLESTGIPVTPGVMTERRVQTVACFSKGVIGVTTPEPRPAASIQLLERFANVFDLTYTRFLDLLQAEAQAREATIEAALEKVRGKAMAMHNSNDLSATASMIFTELRKLGITPIRCGVGLLSKDTRRAQLYSAGDNLSLIGWVQLTGHPVLEKIYDTWLNNKEYYPDLEGEQMRLYYEQLLKGLAVTPPDTSNSQKQYGHFIPFSIGCLYAWADELYDDADIRILKRFASIIDLTFRRYFELQKSEANAREAVKQAALDRVRAEIASMRTITDLDRITPLIWNELTILGLPFIRCGVFLMDEEQQLIHTFLSTPDGKAIAAFHLPYDTPGNLGLVVSNWKTKNIYIDHWNENEFNQFAEILVQQGALDSAENYLKTIPKGGFHLHFLPFLQGMLYVGNTERLKEEQIELIQHVADAFSTAYARYEDFNKLEAAKKQVENTLVDLKQAQQQLVQSEKMASLGELTAGIAHEIQNPLNFVNNFSDVSSELLDEMKNELEKGNKDDAIAIVEDVKQNLEKILHHGKRADAIVKGMLQHSRTSSGQKEMTDINSLTDEYLRLAFHGLRAKDKTFNAKFETHFDDNIGKVNIIPQDIGRVILNLINNAFYTVIEKKKHNDNGYEPTVTVTTLKENGRVEIKVKDNGNGIPQKILDKIFQPFFTTKPTGQGTGLGLSLAYDIVTKGHGGELKVETKEGEGSEFIIQLTA